MYTVELYIVVIKDDQHVSLYWDNLFVQDIHCFYKKTAFYSQW